MYHGSHVLPDRPADFTVVRTYERSIFIRVYGPVHQDNGNSASDRRSYDFSNRTRLVRSHSQQVDILFYEISDILYLFCIAVIGRSDFHTYTRMKIRFPADFIVQLLSPLVITALRHSYQILFLFCPGAGYDGNNCNDD